MEIIKENKKLNIQLLGAKRKDVLSALKKNNSQLVSSISNNELYDFIEPLGPIVYYDDNEIVNAIEISSETDFKIILNNLDLFKFQYCEVINKLIKLSNSYEIEDNYHAVFYDLGVGVANDSDGGKPTSLIIFNDNYYKR